MAHRRANGEGSIFYRPDHKKWVAQVSLNGKRITKYFNTQRECRQWVKEMIALSDNGLTFDEMHITLEEYALIWLASKEQAIRPGTMEQYSQILEQHILPILGEIRLKDIRPIHLRQLYLAKRQSGCGVRTVQLIHAVLYNLLKLAMIDGILLRNPAAVIQRPQQTFTEHKILSREQAQQLILATMDRPLGALIYVALVTAMREGELLGLKWSDLDWESGQLQVQRQVQRIRGKGLVFVPPKTRAGQRKIKLGQRTLERLAAHRQEQERQMAAMGDQWVENDLIFPNTLGKPMENTNMIHRFKALLKENGLPDIRFHDLRHTSISFLLDIGTPVHTVQKRAGHSTASVTMDIYGHSLTPAEADAAEWIEAIVLPAQPEE